MELAVENELPSAPAERGGHSGDSLGTAVGSYVGLASVGGMIGQAVGQRAGNAIGESNELGCGSWALRWSAK